MYEKTAEAHLRLEKTKKVREKISKEIIKYSNRHRRMMSQLGEKHTEEGLSEEETLCWNDLIRKEYALLELSKFLENVDCFAMKDILNPEATIFAVSHDTFDIWLSEDYLFVSTYLFNVMEENIPINEVLNPRFLEFEFVTIFERIQHEEKKREERE